MFAKQQIVLPQYRRTDTPTAIRSGLSLAAKLLLAAGYGALTVMLPASVLFLPAVPIFVLLLLTLWMLPDSETFPIRSIERVYGFLLVFLVLWPAYIAVNVPGLPWVTPTRLLLFLLIAVLLYSVSISGALRHELARVATGSKLLWVAFLGWELMQVVTLALSNQLAVSIKKLVDNQFGLVGIFFVGCLLFTRKGWATKTVVTLVVLAAICCVDGMIELRMEAPPWAGHIPSFLRVDNTILSSVLGSQARAADGIYRVRGPFSNSLILAEYLAVCMPFIIHWLVKGRSVPLRLLLATGWFAIMYGILITNSRLGLVGALMAHVIYFPLWGFRRWKTDSGTLFGPAALLGAPIVAIMLVGLVFSSTTLKQRVFGGGAQAASTEARSIQMDMAIPKVLRNPVGHGLGTSGDVLGFVSPAGKVTVDNHFITTALDLGLPGLISFYAIWLIAAVLAVRMYISTTDPEVELALPLTAVFLIFVTIKSVLSQEDNHSILFLLLGMLLALRARTTDSASEASAASDPDAKLEATPPVRG